MKKVTTIGGGTGQYTLLKGLKNYNLDLGAIVSVMDSGGSSGKLRTAFGVLPPGDIRNCLLALVDDYRLKDLMDVFSYRFSNSKENGLSNHNLGNLILTALTDKYGNIGEAIKAASSILNIKHYVFPISLDSVNIHGKILNSDKILMNEEEISYGIKRNESMERLWLHPSAYIYNESAKRIEDSDLIVICPGLLYGSIIPNFLVKGFRESIEKSKAKIVYVCNLVTGTGMYDFKASDFVREIEKYLNKKIDYLICNNKKPTKKIVDKYLKKEESFFVECDYLTETENLGVIRDNLLVEMEIDNLVTARHNPEKTSRIIMGILSELE